MNKEGLMNMSEDLALPVRTNSEGGAGGKSAQRPPARRQLSGTVVSAKMKKTVVVSVSRLARDTTFKKILRRTKKYKVHDEKNECQVGDEVLISESRPISAEKRWRLNKILKKGSQVDTERNHL